MDFMAEQLCDGRWIRLLTIVDNFTRESLAAEVEQKFSGYGLTAILARIARQRGCPKSIRVDNGPEFTSLSDAKIKIEQWREDYNEARPHESLGYLAPSEFAKKSQKSKRPELV